MKNLYHECHHLNLSTPHQHHPFNHTINEHMVVAQLLDSPVSHSLPICAYDIRSIFIVHKTIYFNFLYSILWNLVVINVLKYMTYIYIIKGKEIIKHTDMYYVHCRCMLYSYSFGYWQESDREPFVSSHWCFNILFFWIRFLQLTKVQLLRLIFKYFN